MNKKKYLLIGDHRTCENYGSIATGDQLIELMKPRRLSVIPITRMDQDYDYMPLTFEEFDNYADKVKKGLVLKMEKRAIDNSDNIIINCEGSLTHHTNASRCEGKYRARTRYMLFLAYYSAKFCGKEVSIVNHCVDPGNSSAEEMIKNVYPLLKRCWVRDNLSKVNLEKLGIDVTVRTIDSAEYQKKIEVFDFDMIVQTFSQSLSPGNEQKNFWGSDAADTNGSRNVIGIKNYAVDGLIDNLINAKDREDLLIITKALDRVLLWNYYVIPQWHISSYRVVYWDFFDQPKIKPKYSLGFDTWWINQNKYDQIQSNRTTN